VDESLLIFVWSKNIHAACETRAPSLGKKKKNPMFSSPNRKVGQDKKILPVHMTTGGGGITEQKVGTEQLFYYQVPYIPGT
jgi:hypothetical protein